MKLTINQVLSWRPCNAEPGKRYSRDNLRKLIGGDEIEALAVLDLPILPEDRLWVLLREEVLSERTLRLLAADFAESVLPPFEARFPGDTSVRELLAGIRDFANGKITREQLGKLRVASAFANAFCVAAVAAFCATASSATYAASSAAVYAVVASCARKEEREKQIELVRKALQEEAR